MLQQSTFGQKMDKRSSSATLISTLRCSWMLPISQGGEQDLEYYELFQEYLRLYEDTMASYIESMDASVEDFYCEMQDVQEDKNIKDKKLVHFVNYMIGSVDYPAFYKMMVRAAKRYSAASMADAKASARAAKANREGAVGLSNMDEAAYSARALVIVKAVIGM